MCEIEKKTLGWSIQRCSGPCWHGNMQSRPQGVVVRGGGQELVDCSISVKIEISVNSEHLGLLADWPINENEPAVICWDWNQREKRQIASECVCACLNACTHLCVSAWWGVHAAAGVWVVVNMRVIDWARALVLPTMLVDSFIFFHQSDSCVEWQQ